VRQQFPMAFYYFFSLHRLPLIVENRSRSTSASLDAQIRCQARARGPRKKNYTIGLTGRWFIRMRGKSRSDF
jgi:hypothetical protein